VPIQSERSLMRMGNTFVVTIPAGWCRYYGLKAKDRVILTANGEIVIRPKRKRRHEGQQKAKARV
jgi:bifunctional DNA-binding transcriptional regulator/antitoxin component of YhaV-PrlF toxin-antitoxin module